MALRSSCHLLLIYNVRVYIHTGCIYIYIYIYTQYIWHTFPGANGTHSKCTVFEVRIRLCGDKLVRTQAAQQIGTGKWNKYKMCMVRCGRTVRKESEWGEIYTHTYRTTNDVTYY